MEVELTLRTSWKGLSIKDYLMYLGALDNPNTNDFEKQLDILAILCSTNRQALNDLPANQVIPLFNKLEFLKVAPKEDARSYYDISGKKFKLCMDVGQITAGQFIDLTNYTKDPDFIMDNLHTICAILLLPVIPYRGKAYPGSAKERIEKYSAETLNDRAEFLFDNMPIGEAIGISNFFTFLWNIFIEITKNYLERERMKTLNSVSTTLNEKPMMKSLKPARDGLKKNGIGSQR